MILPLQSFLTEHREVGLVLALGVGVSFGFVLERAGFGRATKLAAQFYGTDMTVLKVMFGAIVTAMLGLVVLSGLGLADLAAIRESAASWTYLGPMVVGGLVLGVGFIVSGYCPGTSMVGSASGNLDAMVTFGGVIVGSLVYSEIQPAIASFHSSGEMGHVFLYQLLGVSPQLLAAGVTAMAVAAFLFAEWVERTLAKGKSPGPTSGSAIDLRPGRRLAFGAYAALVVVGLGTLALAPVSSQAQPREAASVSPSWLAHRVVEAPWTVRILDLRAADACAASRVPGAECTPAVQLGDLGLAYDAGARDLVLVTDDGLAPVPAEALTWRGDVRLLAGGFEAWKAYALEAPPAPAPDADPATRDELAFRAALQSALTGVKQAPPPPAPTIKFAPPKKKKGGGCS